MPDKLWMLLTLLVVIAWGYMTANPSHTESLNKAQINFEAGCLVSAQSLCPMWEDDIQRGKCYDQALDGCPKSAKKFREYLERGKR